MEDEREIVRLVHPIEYGKDKPVIEELHFRKGRVGDLKGVAVGSTLKVDELILIASRMCGQPTTIIERLHEDDAGEVIARAVVFFGKCLATGSVPSPS